MIKILGIENNLFINNFVMRDCINVFQEEINKDIIHDELSAKSDDEKLVFKKSNKSNKNKKTMMFLKRKSDMQLLNNIKNLRRSAIYKIPQLKLGFEKETGKNELDEIKKKGHINRFKNINSDNLNTPPRKLFNSENIDRHKNLKEMSILENPIFMQRTKNFIRQTEE